MSAIPPKMNQPIVPDENLLPVLQASFLPNRQQFPLKVVQFGEGNFLRAFFDWMIQRLNDEKFFGGSIRVVEPLPTGKGDILNQQDGLYTVLLRGYESGQIVSRSQLISCVEGSYNAYRDWEQVLALARRDSLQFIVSNTTEAGIEYQPEEYSRERTPNTFPAKLTAFLYERFRYFGGSSRSGLYVIPCELIEHNATHLKEYLLRYAHDWGLEESFVRWLDCENHFINTLVDRIVSGYPKTEAEAKTICSPLGYDDQLLTIGEPFHFFALEGSEQMEELLPFRQAGLNVIWTDDITPYRTRKVLLLNGGHTSLVLAAYLCGLNFVHEVMKDSLCSQYLKQLLFQDILPLIPLPEQEKDDYVQSVLERFANPFANHQLYSIALNSVSKWKVRVLPSLLDYYAREKKHSPRLVFSLAALIRFYKNAGGIGHRQDHTEYVIPDSPAVIHFFEHFWNEYELSNSTEQLTQSVLANIDFWGQNLNQLEGLQAMVAKYLRIIEEEGIYSALRELVKEA